MADSQADAVPKSPIIMRVDAPSDEVENNDNEALGHSICSPAPRPMSARFTAFGSKLVLPSSAAGGSRSVLRPSQLSQHVHTTSKPFTLTPGKLNPFLRTATLDDSTDDKKVESTNGETPKFVPLITSTRTTPMVASTSVSSASAADSHRDKPVVASTTNFVFGQNLQERVVNDPAAGSANTSVSSVSSTSDECKPSSSSSALIGAATNGTSSLKEEMLFSSAIKEVPVPTCDAPASGSKSLTESAREYEEQRNNKRKYEEVETKTGEEDETNVMQISCKLFAYDKGVGNWQERGRGILRLNDLLVVDKENDACYTQSRLVFRNSGVHKVILNTKIWAEMTVEQASAKSVRLTAIDPSGEIKVYLVMAAPDETKQLHRLLQERRSAEQRRQNRKKPTMGDAAPAKNDTTSTSSGALQPPPADDAPPLKETSVDGEEQPSARATSVIKAAMSDAGDN